MTINRTDLVNDIAEATAMTKTAVKKVVDALYDRKTERLAAGEEIRISGFGTFSVVHRKASEGRNPRTGEKIHIAASNAPKFHGVKALRDALNPPDTERRVPRRA